MNDPRHTAMHEAGHMSNRRVEAVLINHGITRRLDPWDLAGALGRRRLIFVASFF